MPPDPGAAVTGGAPRSRRAASARGSAIVPDCATELELASALDGSAVVVGLDEVGRGALAGPVVIGACAIRIEEGRVTVPLPDGVRDSKALTAARREALIAPVTAAAHAHALGWASAQEIDERGIMGALTLASLRALDGLGTGVDAILLDGSVDVLTSHLPVVPGEAVPRVSLRVRGDRHCRSVAAASVLAKVARDRRMGELAALAPEYGWASNKGYGSAAHREAILRVGPHAEHRRSWNLSGAPAAASRPARTPRRTATLPADVLWAPDSDDPQEAAR